MSEESRYFNHQEEYDFYCLQKRYKNTQILIEVTSFLDEEFPQWNSHKGVGYWGPRFILDAISEVEEFVTHSSPTYKEWVATIRQISSQKYLEISDIYEQVCYQEIIERHRDHILLWQKDEITKKELNHRIDLLLKKELNSVPFKFHPEDPEDPEE